jgi:flagellar M-ring protein FliF
MLDLFAPLFDRLGGPRRAMILFVGVGAAALIFYVSRWASEPTWLPAFTGVPLESVAQMTDRLDQAGVKYKLERGGADIMVATTDLAKARVALARGGLPNAGRPGLELFDQPSWGMTDFTQRINYRRALEGELERTIGKMRGIEAAQVHLVLHETEAFAAGDRPTEASVVLKLKSESNGEVVKGIAHLVASSVDGLTSEHVTIVDDAGHLLSEAVEPDTPTGLSARQLTVQREIEEYLRGKATQIVSQIVGTNNVRVQVAAAMNFDKIERTSATVDPEKQVVASEQKSEIIPGTQGGAGQNTTATTYDNTRSTESFAAAPGSVKRLTVAVLVGDPLAPAGSKQAPRSRSAAELKQIETLVRSTVGADSVRGDIVSVVSVPFVATPVATVEAPKSDIVTVVRDVQRPIIGLVGLGLIVAVALLSLKSLKRMTPSNASPVLALPRGGDAPVITAIAHSSMPAPVPIQQNGVRDRVASSIEQQPDVAARVVRAWLKEA